MTNSSWLCFSKRCPARLALATSREAPIRACCRPAMDGSDQAGVGELLFEPGQVRNPRGFAADVHRRQFQRR